MLRFTFRLFLIALVAMIVGIGGLATAKRLQTGSWSMPDRDDVAWLRHIIDRDDAPPRVIFLNREDLAVKGGFDEAHANHTQLLERGVTRTVPGFSGSDRQWRRVVRCVQSKFAAFDVTITDRRPSGDDYVMVHVGGTPSDLYGRKRRGMGGVAPFNGDVIADSIVFAFSDTLKNKLDAVCHTVAHEIGHVYGLDHSYRCGDIMTYLQGCGKKRFVDAHVRCGEKRRRDCDHGSVTQNSHETLYRILGPRKRSDESAASAKKSARKRRGKSK